MEEIPKAGTPMRSKIISAISILLVTTLSLAPASWGAGDADDFYEIENGRRQLLELLESLPYATEGAGPVMYTFQYSECPYCQGMYRDYPAATTGLELRRLMVPVSERSSRETAALGSSRDISDYHAFMTGSKVAPSVNSIPQGVVIHNNILAAVGTFESILKQNEWPARGLVFPQFVWMEGGKLFTSAGYEHSDYAKAVSRAQRGGGMGPVWAAAASGQAIAAVQSAEKPQPTGQAIAAVQSSEKSPPAKKPSGTNIVGLELGMSREQLLAAIRAHSTKLNIMEHASDIVVRDSYSQPFKVDTYVAEIQAFWDQRARGYKQSDPKEKISVVFTGPPGEHQAESIQRDVRYVDSRTYPSYDGLVQALLGKYGPADLIDRKSAITRMVWQLDGKSLSERHLKMLGGSALNTNNNHSTRYHLFPIIDESLPPNVLSISDDGIVIRHGNRQYIEGGRFLAVQITQQGAGVHFMRTVLQDSMMKIGRARGATAQMANAALARHEQEKRDAVQERAGPDI